MPILFILLLISYFSFMRIPCISFKEEFKIQKRYCPGIEV